MAVVTGGEIEPAAQQQQHMMFVHCSKVSNPCSHCRPAAANKGIGYEVARLLAEAGMTVVVTSRSGKKSLTLAAGS